jgi:hypothetical protein
MMGTMAEGAAPASAAARLPALAQAMKELRVHGAADCAQWRTLLGQLAAHVRSRDAALARSRRSANMMRIVGVVVVAIVGFYIAFKFHPFAGVVVAIAGGALAFVLIKLPKAAFIGMERIDFVRRIVDELGTLVPEGRIGLSAHLDSGHGIPAVALPGGLRQADVRGEREDAWLRGSLHGIPGLRLSWQATEWRTVSLRRRKNPRGKIKSKAKLALAIRLAARLDADRALFAINPAKAVPTKEAVIDVRETPRGFTVRGWRERSGKTMLSSTNVLDALASLRARDDRQWFGEAPATLLSLMKLCEERLAPRAVPGTTASGGKA